MYEVSWTRLLTLYIGHTTAAASAVVAAFLGGLAVGAGGGGAIATRLSGRHSLYAYIVLELGAALAALVLPWELTALTPLLGWAYSDGAPGLLFPTIRLLACLVMVFVPAAALGATFPLAIRWFASESDNPARLTGALYALNTTGAAVGALVAGFVLIPAIGVSGTTRVGMAASALAAISVLVILSTANRQTDVAGLTTRSNQITKSRNQKITKSRNHQIQSSNHSPTQSPNASLAATVLGLTGFAALMHEIAWTRILSLVLGPTIYAFAATLAAVIAGVALGSGIGTWVVGHTRRPAAWLAFVLAGAAISASYTYSLAGGEIARLVAEQMVSSSNVFDQRLRQGLMLTAALIAPTAACLGAAFPLALSIVGASARDATGRFGSIYAINTLGAVSGSLMAGFVFIPSFGLQTTLRVVSGCLIAAALSVVVWGALATTARVAGLMASAIAAAVLFFSPPWDRELLASGVYMYAPYVPKDLDLATLLKAGTLLYYREGAASTVSVKRLTGTTTLAVDGKTDASNRGDMLTQKLVAHLPLLLHENPRQVGIIGLGSGVTVGSALRHPIMRADVIEISPDVVEASQYFLAENHHALDDPRTNLIVGDGRSHLLLAERQYDVIISEPSNPWIAGVAALFTREFFAAARNRLAPGGVICQWANTYNISDSDLRAIVATFTSVFPDGTLWLVGGDDVLLVASNSFDVAQGGPTLDARLANIERHWTRPGVAADLAEVSALEPFSIWSLFVGGPDQLARYSEGAAILTDDRMTLEFSGPREIHSRSGGENSASLSALLGPEDGPELLRRAKATASATQWRNRGAMMAKRDAHLTAYDDYVRAVTLDPSDDAALEGLVRTAVLTRRSTDALSWVTSLTANRPSTPDVLVATSKLLAANGFAADAVETARQATRILPVQSVALEQLASLHAEAGDVTQLDATVDVLQHIAPDGASTQYYAAAAAFLRGQVTETVRLAERAIAIDPTYAPVYDLIGAAYTKLARLTEARKAFETSLGFDAHDSTAYTNLGLLELASGNRPSAARHFAEALWLAPDSTTAREGLAQAR